MQQNNSLRMRAGESGNVFFLIMIGIVLFAALMFTFTKGMRQGGGNISRKAAEIAAMDILDYSQAVERGTQRVLSRECSENDISFFMTGVDALADYEHSPPSADKCKVFHPSGGAIGYQPPPPESGATAWMFSGANAVPGIATNLNDLIIWLPYVNSAVCAAINAKLGVGDVAPTDAGAVSYEPFTGSFDGGETISDAGHVIDSRNSGCFTGGTIDGGPENGGYHYFHVIYAR